MGKGQTQFSRRKFLGGSVAAAVGGLAAGTLSPRSVEAQKAVPALPLSELEPSGMLDEAYWWRVRSQFNVVDGMRFMNNGTLGPVPRFVRDENQRIFREIAEDPTNGYRREELDENRKLLAEFVGAAPAEIAYSRSTTEGMNMFAHGIDWREGDEVIMNLHEHPGGYEVYELFEKRYGIQIKWIEIPSPPESTDQVVELYAKAIGPRSRAIVVSHMTYVTGLLTPVKELSELAHQRGLLISVDGAHPLGMIAMDFHELGCDHYAGAGQKWLLCGTGTGLTYFKKDVQEQIWPFMSYGGSKEDGELVMYEDARKYEDCGQRDVPSALGMASAVTFQQTIGKRNIEGRVRSLATRLKDGLQEIPGVKLWTSTDPQLSGGLTLFSVRDVPMDNVQKALLDQFGVYIRTMTTGNLNAVRASTHFYNMPGDVDRLLEGVRHIAQNWSDYMTPTASA